MKTAKEIGIICEKCSKEYAKAAVSSYIKGKKFLGGYCDKCSDTYQIKKFGKISLE